MDYGVLDPEDVLLWAEDAGYKRPKSRAPSHHHTHISERRGHTMGAGLTSFDSHVMFRQQNLHQLEQESHMVHNAKSYADACTRRREVRNLVKKVMQEEHIFLHHPHAPIPIPDPPAAPLPDPVEPPRHSVPTVVKMVKKPHARGFGSSLKRMVSPSPVRAKVSVARKPGQLPCYPYGDQLERMEEEPEVPPSVSLLHGIPSTASDTAISTGMTLSSPRSMSRRMLPTISSLMSEQTSSDPGITHHLRCDEVLTHRAPHTAHRATVHHETNTLGTHPQIPGMLHDVPLSSAQHDTGAADFSDGAGTGPCSAPHQGSRDCQGYTWSPEGEEDCPTPGPSGGSWDWLPPNQTSKQPEQQDRLPALHSGHQLSHQLHTRVPHRLCSIPGASNSLQLGMENSFSVEGLGAESSMANLERAGPKRSARSLDLSRPARRFTSGPLPGLKALGISCSESDGGSAPPQQQHLKVWKRMGKPSRLGAELAGRLPLALPGSQQECNSAPPSSLQVSTSLPARNEAEWDEDDDCTQGDWHVSGAALLKLRDLQLQTSTGAGARLSPITSTQLLLPYTFMPLPPRGLKASGRMMDPTWAPYAQPPSDDLKLKGVHIQQ